MKEATNNEVLEVRNLHTHFHLANGGVARAVNGVSLEVKRGRTLAIVGESGSGKSQTALSVMGLLDANAFHPDGSAILLEGENLLQKEESELRKIRGNRMAMIFQEPTASLNPLFRVSNQLAEPLRLHQAMSGKKLHKRIVELLRQVGIPEPELRATNYPHEMSGGMKQRVMIAMALACGPSFLIADEPTTALDVTIQAQILGLMDDLRRRNQMGVMLITHDLGVVEQIADEVAVMYAGRIVESGSREEVLGNPQHPYTKLLLRSMPDRNNPKYRLRTIHGRVPPADQFTDAGCQFANRCPIAQPRCHAETPDLIPVSGGSEHSSACYFRGEMNNVDLDKNEQRPLKTSGGKPILDVSGLRTFFPVKKGILRRTVNFLRAVDGVSLTLRPGETLALVGESGSGKTTVGHSILRLLNEAKGRIVFQGVDVLSLGAGEMKKFRSRMQLVFQDPLLSLSPRMRVGAIIGEGLRVHEGKRPAAEREQAILETLDLVGLPPETMHRYPHEFSGGQRQRIALARSLILNPDLLILDEPTSALDVSVQAQILNLLESIQSRLGLAYLFITHDLGVVRYLADAVAVMYLGRIVESATVADLFSRPRHPYTRMLLQSIPSGPQNGNAFTRITGEIPSPVNPPPGCHFHPRCPVATDICREEYPQEATEGTTRFCCHNPLTNSPETTKIQS